MFFDHMEEIEKLIKMVSESNLSEFTVEEDEMEIVIRKMPPFKQPEHRERKEMEKMPPQEPSREFGMHPMSGYGGTPMPMQSPGFGMESMSGYGGAPISIQPQRFGINPMAGYEVPMQVMQPSFGVPSVQPIQVPPVSQDYVPKYVPVMQNEASVKGVSNQASVNNTSSMGAVKQETMLDGNQVESPLVGTFYAASSPDKEPFVKKGDMVKKGQVLGIVEAMKLMNEIECEYDGVVVDILVQNGDMVEYGQPLFIIK